MKVRACLVLLLAVFVAAAVSGEYTSRVHAATQSLSTVSISPVTTCCQPNVAPIVPLQPGSNFNVDVKVNLVAGESMNGFDIRVNYTNPQLGASSQSVLHADSIMYDSNILSTHNPQPTVQFVCIDGLLRFGTGDCGPESVGQVHIVEVVAGSLLNGPLSGKLFSIRFDVVGTGSSLIAFDRAQLFNPNPDPSNPTYFHFRYVPVLEYAGIFGNQGVTAFFNFQTSDTSVSPSVIPNQPVDFDASNSFVANDTAKIKLYSWDFGDGNKMNNITNSMPTHPFSFPGNYTVVLKVWDDKNRTGPPLVRRITVQPALGKLDLTVDDLYGNPERGNVLVKLFNSSSSPTPVTNQTTNQAGIVDFGNLTAGSYYLTFSGQGVKSSDKTEKVIPGYTMLDTVYLTSIPNAPDYTGLIYAGTILAGLGIISGIVIYRKRVPSRALEKSRGRPSMKAKGSSRSRAERQR